MPKPVMLYHKRFPLTKNPPRLRTNSLNFLVLKVAEKDQSIAK